MKIPSNRFLVELAKALGEAEHQIVAQHIMAGALWAMYPEWFEKSGIAKTVERPKKRL